MDNIIWQSAISEVLPQDFVHPGLRTVRFIFCDDQPNENGQGIEYSDFAELKQSAIGTPIKVKFLGKGVGGHYSSIPIGHIKAMSEREAEGGVHQLIADGILYAEEYPDEVEYLAHSFAEGKAPGVSWELSYNSERSIVKNGIQWLKGLLTRAATFVSDPAYGNRTAILALASNRNIDAAQFMEELTMLVGEAATWSSAYINSLPDSSFACVNKSGRHYPYKDASGKVDLPHLRAALSRIGDPSNEQCGKDKLRAAAKTAGIGEAEIRELEGGNNSMDEKELQKLKEDLAAALAAIATKEAEITTLTTENTSLKTSLSEKETVIAEFTKAKTLSERLATIASAGIPVETDAAKLGEKKEFYLSFSDAAFATYVEELKSVQASATKGASSDRAVASRGRQLPAIPRFGSNDDEPATTVSDLGMKLRNLSRTPVTTE